MSQMSNAVALSRDADFRDWVMVGCCFQARNVIASGSGTVASRKLAADTIGNPSLHLERWVHVLAADPALCGVGATVGETEGKIGQTLLLTQITATWTALSAVLYPVAS